jgi:hypothetical protein
MESQRFRLRVFIILFAANMLVGTFGFMIAEGISLGDAIYFSIVTITTVGYGDIHPATAAGKILAIVLIITGVGTFLGVVANVTEILVDRREKQLRLQKVNMVIGVFFSEIGTRLLSLFSGIDPNLDDIRPQLIVKNTWSDNDFATVKARLKDYNYRVDPLLLNPGLILPVLQEKSNFLLRLWENPNLLEHGFFTELLRAVFHLKEELLSRDDLSNLPESDLGHLAGDVNRAYSLMVLQWVDYMKHLKEEYPYLFSHAVRTNPFDHDASPVVRL